MDESSAEKASAGSGAQAAPGADGGDIRPEDLGHPKGTLAIVVLYGLLFAATWLGLYLFEFLPRGVPQP